jgi:hypothetical protein
MYAKRIAQKSAKISGKMTVNNREHKGYLSRDVVRQA